MNNDLEKIAGDLERLLETIKVKPVVVTETKEPVKSTLTENTIAPQLTSAVFKTVSEGASLEDVSYCLIGMAELKAEELGLSKRKMIESVLNYCLDLSEALTAELESDDLLD